MVICDENMFVIIKECRCCGFCFCSKNWIWFGVKDVFYFKGVNDMEKVLVLMATYNGEKYLQEQLDSIYAQRDVDVRILVRDDGSKDSTLSILADNEKKHQLCWYQGTHLNVQKGFYELMTKATDYDCDYFAFCDQDDVWDLDKLKIAIDAIENIEIPMLYYSGQRLVDENLNFIENHRLNEYRTLKTRFVLSDFAGCTGVFNRALLNEIISFEPEYMLMHDTWILRVCLCLGGNVVVDPNPHMNYRQHSGNTLGLGHSVGATIKQVRQYIYEYQIERLTRELLRGYGDRMIPEYKELAEVICSYRVNGESRKYLLNKNNVDFVSKGLNATYRIKVKINKL